MTNREIEMAQDVLRELADNFNVALEVTTKSCRTQEEIEHFVHFTLALMKSTMKLFEKPLSVAIPSMIVCYPIEDGRVHEADIMEEGTK